MARALLLLLCTGACAAAAPVVVGSKKFTESVILGALTTERLQAAGVAAVHRSEIGGTRVLWKALLQGDIDLYPEYTGTLFQEIFPALPNGDLDALRRALAARGLRMSAPLGFENSYALGMREGLARRLGIRRISDLAAHPGLVFGFSNEFMDRPDGWAGLRRAYGLAPNRVRGMDHDLAYRALAAGDIQVIDLYTTDAEIPYYGLRVLRDERGFFPDYRAVLLYRTDLGARHPAAVPALDSLRGRIDAATMARLNARAKIEGVPAARVAADFLHQRLGLAAAVREPSLLEAVGRRTLEHLVLVLVSLSAAIVVAVPLGVAAARRPRLGQAVLAVAGILQTVPALALLVFMIPLFGIGGPPAVAALFLYSLLPIVRNTHAGLRGIPAPLRESAEALGLPPAARLRRVELPLAAGSILAGVKTSAVINIGTATLGALIGAGGYGQPILTGIRLDDMGLILQGAVPAAVLALLVQGAFELAERRLVSPGLRPGAAPR